jgi:hypothetical protein
MIAGEDDTFKRGLAETFERDEAALLQLLDAHRLVCPLCEAGDNLRSDCRMGSVLREAWWDAWRLLREPSRWTVVEVIAPLSPSIRVSP